MSWIDLTGAGVRSNGWDENDYIEIAPYQIESILRDEVFVERDLTTTTKGTASSSGGFYYYVITCSGLKSTVNDYYNNAEVFNVTTNKRYLVDDYLGATKEITLKTAIEDTALAAGDNIFVTNIQGDNRIDIVSFDLIGHATNGSRKNWKFGRSIYQTQSANNLVGQLCYESFCMLFSSYNVYKLVALDSASSADTWTKCLKTEGREYFDIKLTPLQNTFTSFRLKYAFDYAKNKYMKEFYVDKNGYTSGGTVISATEKTLCENAETNYKIKNNFEYSSDWIYDLTTAEYLLQKLVLWFTKQRMMVTWTTPLSDGTVDYIKYELGDQVVLTNTRILPTGISGVKCFMITGKQIIIKRGDPYIIWNLIEMEDLPT